MLERRGNRSEIYLGILLYGFHPANITIKNLSCSNAIHQDAGDFEFDLWWAEMQLEMTLLSTSRRALVEY